VKDGVQWRELGAGGLKGRLIPMMGPVRCWLGERIETGAKKALKPGYRRWGTLCRAEWEINKKAGCVFILYMKIKLYDQHHYKICVKKGNTTSNVSCDKTT
jgi:hypothetical protein